MNHKAVCIFTKHYTAPEVKTHLLAHCQKRSAVWAASTWLSSLYSEHPTNTSPTHRSRQCSLPTNVLLRRVETRVTISKIRQHTKRTKRLYLETDTAMLLGIDKDGASTHKTAAKRRKSKKTMQCNTVGGENHGLMWLSTQKCNQGNNMLTCLS